jgi:RTX calcium-binding nonapeptide repeat (4 copies)
MRSRLIIVAAAVCTAYTGLSASAVGAATIRGTSDADSLVGTRKADVVYSRGGDDAARGRRGGDTLYGNAGADELSGGAGRDRLTGGRGADVLSGGDGRDRLDARDGAGGDSVSCGAGEDSALADEGDLVVDCEERHVGCSLADALGCAAESTLVLTDTKFFCNRPLAEYGELPLLVRVEVTPGQPFGENGAIDLDSGCAGDGDPETIDLIVDVPGDGRTYGPGVDAFKVRNEAGYDAGIQVTGHVDCGPRYSPAEHQDGVQLQGGRDITFIDFSVGDYRNGRSTCQGAGGAFFYSGANGSAPSNVDVIRGEYIACNHSLYAGDPGTGEVRGAKFRSGRVDGSDPVCSGYHGSEACDGDGGSVGPGVTMADVICERWSAQQDAWQ